MQLVCRFILFSVAVVLALGRPCLAASDAAPDHEWHVGVYGGKVTDNTIQQLIEGDVDIVDSKFLVVTLGKRLTTYRELIDVEAEGQAGKHWGIQDHYEFNAVIFLRWLPFPWDKYLDTSFAVGEGFSYATQKPEVEIRNDGKTAKFLNYLGFELDFALPGAPSYSLFTRLHHRSGIFGLIDGVHGGSNALGVGIKHSF